MERQIFFLLVALVGVWLIYDDTKGNRTLTRFIVGVME